MVSFSFRSTTKKTFKNLSNTGHIFTMKTYYSKLQSVIYHLISFYSYELETSAWSKPKKVGLLICSKMKTLACTKCVASISTSSSFIFYYMKFKHFFSVSILILTSGSYQIFYASNTTADRNHLLASPSYVFKSSGQ